MPTGEMGSTPYGELEDDVVRLGSNEPGRQPRKGQGRIVAIVLSIAVIVIVFIFALPSIAAYGAVWDVVNSLSWPWIGGLLVASTLRRTAHPGWQRCQASPTGTRPA
jgi:hypothetical protein